MKGLILVSIPVITLVPIFFLFLRKKERSQSMKKYAESIGAGFEKKEKNHFLKTDNSYRKYNIILGKYNNKPLEVYHCKISAVMDNLSTYHTSINGRMHDGLLSSEEINNVLNNIGNEVDANSSSVAKRLRKIYPWQ